DNRFYTFFDMTYQIGIANKSLVGVRVVVYENGCVRDDLSKRILFSSLLPQNASFSLDASGAAFNVVFLPIGKIGSSAAITIDQ
ncbi:MAG: hypothetical protein Q8R42_08715, partial [Desulfocapsaceae bacterium]|nr:hypothetical protein [Desulfocapsaceae bacterium]